MKMIYRMMLAACCFAAATFNVQAQTAEEDRMLTTAIKYLDTPYKAHVLDEEPREEMMLNTDELDCTTLVEYVLAESLCPIINGDISESTFADKVQMIRYRDGKVNGYSSRLHYMTDWIDNGVRHGFLEDITAQRSQDTLTVQVSYMSSHAEKYRQLAQSPAEVEKMRQVEQRLSGRIVHYLPKDKLPNNGLAWIKNGDIIAITTNTPGLDIAHMGIAFYADGKLTLIHASSEARKVVASTTTLAKMLEDHPTWTGIRVVRMKK